MSGRPRMDWTLYRKVFAESRTQVEASVESVLSRHWESREALTGASVTVRGAFEGTVVTECDTQSRSCAMCGTEGALEWRVRRHRHRCPVCYRHRRWFWLLSSGRWVCYWCVAFDRSHADALVAWRGARRSSHRIRWNLRRVVAGNYWLATHADPGPGDRPGTFLYHMVLSMTTALASGRKGNRAMRATFDKTTRLPR